MWIKIHSFKQMNVHFFSYVLLIRLYFIHWIVFAPFLKMNWPYMWLYFWTFYSFDVCVCVCVCVCVYPFVNTVLLSWLLYLCSKSWNQVLLSPPNLPRPSQDSENWNFQLRHKEKKLNMSLMTPHKDRLMLTVNSFSLCT